MGDPGQVSAMASGQWHSSEAGLFPARVRGGSEGLWQKWSLPPSRSHRGQGSSDFCGVTCTGRFSLFRDHRGVPLKEQINQPPPQSGCRLTSVGRGPGCLRPRSGWAACPQWPLQPGLLSFTGGWCPLGTPAPFLYPPAVPRASFVHVGGLKSKICRKSLLRT